MNTYTVTENLSLVNFPVSAETKVVNENIHQIILVDRSGSMYSVLSRVIEDIKKKIRTLKVGDALTFGYFSSKGQFGFPIRMFRIVNEKSFDELDRLFDKHKNTLGLTCFSESLEEAVKVLKDAEFLGLKNTMLFFSDGMPNDPSYSGEVTKIKAVMPLLGEGLDMFLAVAHSDYSDKDLLAEMAELAGGESVTSTSFESFTRLMEKYLRATAELTPRQVVEVKADPTSILSLFSFGKESVNVFTLRDDGTVASNQDVWALVKGEAGQTGETPLEAMYAAALTLCRKGQVDTALEVLNVVGDKALIDKLYSALTPSERGAAEDAIKDAIFDENARYINGKAENYLPDPNAPCLLDLVEKLQNDDQAFFYPRHPAFQYNAIGRKPIIEEGFPKFNAYLENRCPISQFTWNKEFLNLSILATVQGTVKLNEIAYRKEKGATATGDAEVASTPIDRPASLGTTRDTFQWKNYALVKDGFLNIQSFPISASEETIRTLTEWGVVAAQDGDVTVLDLTKIPVVNKAAVAGDISAQELMTDVVEENLLQGQLKVLNALRKEIAPDAPKIPNDWTEEEREYLLAAGFREDNSYSPPSHLDDPTDFYEAVAFTTSIQGVKALPSLNDVRKRQEAKKDLLLGQKFLAPTLEDFQKQAGSMKTDDQVKWIDNNIKSAKFALNGLRKRIQARKFGLILGRKWFTDLDQADAEQTVTVPTSRINGETEITGVIQVQRKVVKI